MAYEGQLELDVERRFDVYEIHWAVRDFSLVTCGVGWSLQSPVFTVRGRHVTTWMIFLCPASNKLHPDFMALTLKRCEADGGPDSICVEWKMTINISQRNQEIALERLSDFTMGSEYKENLKTLKSSIEAIKSFDSDIMTVRCKMIVHDRNEKKEFEPSPDPGKCKLSENLLNMFLEGVDCDLKLKIGEKTILAHKAVVCSRIAVLNQLLEESEVVNDNNREVHVIDMSYLNHEAMMKILEYVYSGDLIHILEEPSLAMLENVQSLDMYHLKKIYNAKELFFRTLMNVQETRFTWTIEDFFEDYENFLVSPHFIDDLSGTWRMRIFQGKNNYSDYFSVLAEHVGEAELGNLCVEFSIADEHGQSVFAKLLRKAEDDCRPLRVDKFIRRSTLRTLLIGTTLRLTLKIKLSTGNPSSYVERQDISVVTNSMKTDSFDLLSREMLDLLELSDFADVWLQCKGLSFGVHTCIVSSRCSVLLNLINNGKDENNYVLVEHIEPDILEALLCYIYGGVLPKKEDRSKVPELREAAVRFQLPLLEELCEEMSKQMDNR